ncbi:MAG: MarR family transcriptional regulator [Bacteroidales bacterium]|nr:MarR family transcriptional regulator [Bacteroidales bacterium]
MAYSQLNINNQICFRLYTASRLVVQCYRPFLDKLGLTYLQYIVMLVLWEKDEVFVGDISKKLMLDTNTITPLLQRMEKEGFITRKKSIKDARQRIISLTPKGKALEEEAKDIPECIADYVLKNNLNIEELQTFVPVLDNIIGALKNQK